MFKNKQNKKKSKPLLIGNESETEITKNIDIKVQEELALNENDNSVTDKIKQIKSQIEQQKIKRQIKSNFNTKNTINTNTDNETSNNNNNNDTKMALETNFNTNNNTNSIKKTFLSEAVLKNSQNDEAVKDILGIKRAEAERVKQINKAKLFESQKDLYTLPSNLQIEPATKMDYAQNLLKLSQAGLIEVSLPIETRLKTIEANEIEKRSVIDNRLMEELDYLKVLQKLGPSYSKGYKTDMSHKKLAELEKSFGNVFSTLNGKKRKLMREKVLEENRAIEKASYQTNKKTDSE